MADRSTEARALLVKVRSCVDNCVEINPGDKFHDNLLADIDAYLASPASGAPSEEAVKGSDEIRTNRDAGRTSQNVSRVTTCPKCGEKLVTLGYCVQCAAYGLPRMGPSAEAVEAALNRALKDWSIASPGPATALDRRWMGDVLAAAYAVDRVASGALRELSDAECDRIWDSDVVFAASMNFIAKILQNAPLAPEHHALIRAVARALSGETT